MWTKSLSSASGMTVLTATLKVCLLRNPLGVVESDVLPEREPGDYFMWRCPEVLVSLCVGGLLGQPSLWVIVSVCVYTVAAVAVT